MRVELLQLPPFFWAQSATHARGPSSSNAQHKVLANKQGPKTTNANKPLSPANASLHEGKKKANKTPRSSHAQKMGEHEVWRSRKSLRQQTDLDASTSRLATVDKRTINCNQLPLLSAVASTECSHSLDPCMHCIQARHGAKA